MALVNPASPGTGQLAQIGYAAEGYQVGIGPSYGQATPADVYISPTTGTTITPLSSVLLINAAGTIAALTVQLPSNAVNGQRFQITSNQTITSLTLTAGTNATGATDTIVGGYSAAAFTISATFGTSLASVEYVYQLSPGTNQVPSAANLYTWYRVK